MGKGNRVQSFSISKFRRRKVANVLINFISLQAISDRKGVNITIQITDFNRLSSTRDSQWRIANIQSASCVSNDCAAEQIRRSLETCNLEDAIARFISGNATGSKR